MRKCADIFALLVHKVKHIPGAIHWLHILEGTQLNTKIGQKPLTPPQAAYFLKALDVMIEAGICGPIEGKDVKCVSPITLSAKAHSTLGMTMDELHQKLNSDCNNLGVPLPFIGPPEPTPYNPELTNQDLSPPQKWRVCTNYRELNKVMQVLPMPQGNIHMKQQALCGH